MPAKVVQYAGGDLHSFVFHVGTKHPDSNSEHSGVGAIKSSQLRLHVVLGGPGDGAGAPLHFSQHRATRTG